MDDGDRAGRSAIVVPGPLYPCRNPSAVPGLACGRRPRHRLGQSFLGFSISWKWKGKHGDTDTRTSAANAASRRKENPSGSQKGGRKEEGSVAETIRWTTGCADQKAAASVRWPARALSGDNCLMTHVRRKQHFIEP